MSDKQPIIFAYVIGKTLRDVVVVAVNEQWETIAQWMSSSLTWARKDIARAVERVMGDQEYELRWLPDPEADPDWRRVRDEGMARESADG